MLPSSAAILCLLLTGQITQKPPAARQPWQGEVGGEYLKLVDPQPSDELYPVNVNNYWGLMNRRGQLLAEPRYDWTDYSYDGICRVVDAGRTGFIKGNGSLFLDQSWRYADRFCEGFAVVSDGEHFGIIDRRGQWVAKPELDGALRFSEGLAAVMVRGRCGFLDVRGQLVIPLTYAQVRSFHNGFASVRLPDENGSSGARGYIDQRGRWALRDDRGELAELGDFYDGLAKVRIGEKWGYLDQRMKPQIPPTFEAARDFINGKAAVRLDGKWGYIDRRGQIIVQPRYEAADDFDQTLALVRRDGLWGYVDAGGREQIEPQYAEARPFLRDLAAVKIDAGWGYIDAGGAWVLDPRVALNGFVDLRASETAAIVSDPRDRLISNRIYNMPPHRDPRPAPYPPEHEYEPILPASAGNSNDSIRMTNQ
ncbi:MAG: WG repeat-containing protein [Phycisphaeraceae bacterium]|nr:WG repeat-containing protein [Phycisphaeraceae bacterium]